MTDLIDRSSEQAADADPADDPSREDAATAAAPDDERAAPFDLPFSVRSALGALLAAAGVIHLVMVPSHWGESGVEGPGFMLSGWLQIALAVALLRRPARWMLQLSVLSNVVLVAVWVVSRTAGLPFGQHAGHAETVSVVDGTTVGLELAAVALALGLLLRGAGFVRADSRAFALGVPVMALVLASVAIASPSARNHAAGSHGDHGAMGHEHGHADDKGLSLLTNGHQHGQGEEQLDDATQAELAVQLAGTRVLVERYPTLADARAAGYTRAGPHAPGAGAHYQPPNGGHADANGNGLIDSNEIDRPFLIYDGWEADAPLAGFMYYVSGDEVPEGFVGSSDGWHYHSHICLVPSADGGVDAPIVDDEDATEAMCNDLGGEWLAVTGNMLHVWTVPGYESERGVFSDVNPTLTCPDGTYYMIPLEDSIGRDTLCRNTGGT